MKNLLIFPTSFGKFSQEPEQILKDAGIHYDRCVDDVTTEEALIEKLQGYQAAILGLEPMTRRVMDACPELKIIVRYGVGLDSVDLVAAKEKNIQVFNTPGANANAVADYTFGMMLDLARCISNANRDLKGDNVGKYTGYPVAGATIGIVGMGAIGKGMLRRAAGFGMKLMAYDVYWDEAFATEHHVIKASLEELYAQADFISLHSSLTEETRNMISTAQLKLMKPTAFLINCARGGLVDEDALYQALVNGEIAGAGIDAFCQEPPTGSPLLTLDNVIAAPHIAGSSIGALTTMATMSASKCVEGFGA